MRAKIYEVIEVGSKDSRLCQIYDIVMMIMVIANIIPLAFERSFPILTAMNYISAGVFIIDYLLRWLTADFKLEGMGWRAFVVYPFTPMAIVDLLAIVSSFPVFGGRIRLLKMLRIVRLTKLFRYSKSCELIANVIRKEKRSLTAVGTFVVGYILVSALLFYNAENELFESFFDAIYFATVSLTTIGFGDIAPKTDLGKLMLIVSSLMGVGVIALPSGIITSGFLSVVKEREEREEKKEAEKEITAKKSKKKKKLKRTDS